MVDMVLSPVRERRAGGLQEIFAVRTSDARVLSGGSGEISGPAPEHWHRARKDAAPLVMPAETQADQLQFHEAECRRRPLLDPGRAWPTVRTIRVAA